ncbi:MAG TPA: protease inhibitor I9 family protein, partial [Xanthomonadales bacterium]|nr:protease inhibitor I9 family protein [Xanthomonadales bacterium]
MNLWKIRISVTWCLALLAALVVTPLAAKSPAADAGRQTYIVVLEQAPVAEWHRNRPESETQSLESEDSPGAKAGRGRIKLDMESSDVRGYLRQLDDEFEVFKGDVAQALGREVNVRKRFRVALNGFSASLTASEARALEALPQVRSARPEEIHKLHTDAGPPWIGAPDIWNGVGSLPAV